MWGVALIYIVVASCNAELNRMKTVDLPTKTKTRIVGGSATTIEKYRFAVQVLYKSLFHGGGSLVTRRHVLSAAHCFVDINGHLLNMSSFSIREGTTFMNEGGSVHLITAIIVHELYNSTNDDNDVAVVMMATRIDLTTSVARIVRILKQDAEVPDNSFVTAVGWGMTNESIPVPTTVLNQVTVRIINLNTCRARYMRLEDPRPITSSMICAGILDVGGKDACGGDSGGALLYSGIVVGISSWGVGCGHPKYPGVYARVAKFTNWIKYTVKNSRQQNGTGYCTCSLSSKVGAITLLTSLLFLILSG